MILVEEADCRLSSPCAGSPLSSPESATIESSEVRMTINLRPEHEQLIAEAIQSGAYQNPNQVIERALEVLRLEDEQLHNDRDLIHEKIERAFAQFERGEFFSAEESRANMEKRKATWIAEQTH